MDLLHFNENAIYYKYEYPIEKVKRYQLSIISFNKLILNK